LLLGGGGFKNKLEVEGKGGIILTMIDEIKDVVLILKKTFDKESSSDKRLSV
jgi:hypothetical protein